MPYIVKMFICAPKRMKPFNIFSIKTRTVCISNKMHKIAQDNSLL